MEGPPSPVKGLGMSSSSRAGGSKCSWTGPQVFRSAV